MAAPAAATSEIQKLKQGFPQQAIACLAVLAIIHILPMSHTPRDSFRLLCTVVYFGALLMLLWLINKPRSVYMKRIYELKYSEGGPALEQTCRMYLSALNRLCSMASYVLLAFVGANAAKVLAKWMPVFIFLDPIATLVWWGGLAGIVTFPWWGKSYLSDTMQKHRLLQESIESLDFQPKNLADLEAQEVQPDRPAVEVVDGLTFTAGRFNWSWKDFCKNCVIFGQPGTGKTVCVLNALLDGLLLSNQRAKLPCAGLILDPKGDFRRKINTVCRRSGRERDIVVIDPYAPNRSIRWNPLDSDDDELEVASRFAAALEALGMKSGSGDTFWIDSAKKFIRHAISLLRITNPEGEPPTFAQIGTLASSMARLSETADLVADDDPRGDQCLAFFADEWSVLADQTRSSIQAYITNMIDPFLMEPYATVFAGRSTMRIADMIDSGKILYVYMPIADKEAMSKVICTFVKLEYYREVLKRPDKPRLSFFLCDEFQSYFTPMPGKGDADFFERSRQSNQANIIATQNYAALTKVAGDRESVVSNLLGNCALKIFLRNTDEKTNDYGSKLFGQAMVVVGASNVNQGSGKGLGPHVGASGNRQYDAKVRPEEFVSLKIPADGLPYCETIVHLGSRAQVTKEKLRWKVHVIEE
ncbi:MAG TPA: type IV secretion system DNA-binding domain-containing protein [Bryobacteraceae bacterium]|nr:type IV secretion system DNA-binding domain-containing protein [Bryobacteraceae bacterium]